MHNYKGNQLFSTTPCPLERLQHSININDKNTFRTGLVKHIITLIGEKKQTLLTQFSDLLYTVAMHILQSSLFSVPKGAVHPKI